jgi:flagellar L-ring protein precursor FlgH
MMHKGRVFAGLVWLSLGLVSGCASAPQAFVAEFAPVVPAQPVSHAVPTGSLFMAGNTNWFGQQRAHQVGDSVTILLQESTQSERSQNVSTSRESSNDLFTPAQVARLAGTGGFFNSPEFWNGSSISSDGSGESGQSASLTGSITATVVEVLANGSMIIQGEKILTMTEGSERIRLRGIIRPDDISPANTVLSYRLANAQISYEGKGDLARAARPGWGTRFFQSVWPF